MLFCGLAFVAITMAGSGIRTAQAGWWPFSSGSERKIKQERTTTLDGGGLARLVLDDSNGNVDIRGGAGSQITLRVIKQLSYKSGMSDADASRTLERLKVDVVPRQETLEVHTTIASLPLGVNGSVNYEIQLPAAMRVEAKTANGNVKIKGINGTVDARTNNGNVDFEKLGGTLEAHTKNGNVRLSEVAGTANVETNNGNITGRQVGAALTAKTNNGNIDIKEVQGSLKASTHNGNLRSEDVDGDLDMATANGNADCVQSRRLEKTGHITIESSTGGIRLALDGGQPFQLEAQSRMNAIQSAFPVQIEKNGIGKRASGQVGQGGPAIKLTTGNGRIDIRKK